MTHSSNHPTVSVPRYLLICLTCLFVSCGGPNDIDNNPSASHPTASHAPHNDEVDLTLGSSTDDSTRYNYLDQAFSIGARDTPSTEVFGRISDIAAGNGYIFVLDRANNEIVSFSTTGAFHEKIGEGGPGPSQLQQPSSLALQGDTLYLTDRSSLIKVFTNVYDDARYDTSFSTRATASDICTLGKHIIIRRYTPSDSSTISVYTPDGSYIRSFGQPYQVNNESLRGTLSRQGSIACHNDRELIAASFRRLPYVYLYDIHGQLAQAVKIRDFTPPQVHLRQSSNGSMQVVRTKPSPGTTFLTGIIGGSSDILTQVTEITEDSPRTHTFWYSPAQQTHGYLGTSVPTLYTSDENVLYGARLHPHPQVIAYRVTHGASPEL